MSKSNISFNPFFYCEWHASMPSWKLKINRWKIKKITKERFITLLRPFHPTLGSHKKLLTYILPSSSNFLFIPCNQSDNYYNQCHLLPSQSEYPMSKLSHVSKSNYDVSRYVGCGILVELSRMLIFNTYYINTFIKYS